MSFFKKNSTGSGMLSTLINTPSLTSKHWVIMLSVNMFVFLTTVPVDS